VVGRPQVSPQIQQTLSTERFMACISFLLVQHAIRPEA
jgi:hypothetical protein